MHVAGLLTLVILTLSCRSCENANAECEVRGVDEFLQRTNIRKGRVLHSGCLYHTIQLPAETVARHAQHLVNCYFPDLLTEDMCAPRDMTTNTTGWKKRSRKCILCFRWGLTFCSPSATT
jgi:hypothetical protein